MYRSANHTLLLSFLDRIEKEKGRLHTKGARNFIVRLAANFDEILELYSGLYYDHKYHDKCRYRLIECLYAGYSERSKSLKDIDNHREKDPNWLLNQQWVGMSLYTEHFSKNLKGFTDQIDYLQDLGVNVVHLMPVLKSPKKEGDGGYSVSDYRSIQPRIGKISDIQDITKIFRKKGMLLALDLVLNHTSKEHKWAKKALEGNKKYQGYYHMYDDRTIPDQYETHMPEVFPVTAPGNFTYQKKIKKWVMTVFHQYQWDLNYANPAVLVEMVEILIYLANQGIDILRLDAPAFLWKELGTSCQNLPQTHNILKLLKRCAEVVTPGVKFLAEAIVAPSEIIKYFGTEENHECDIAYNATLMALIWESLATTKTGVLYKSLSKLPVKPFGSTWINYVRCHDDIGLGFDDEYIRQVGFDPGMHRAFVRDYYTGKFKGSYARGALFMSNPLTGDARISGSLASLAGLEKALEEKNMKQVKLSLRRIILCHALIMSYGGLPFIYSGDEIAQLNDYDYQKIKSKQHDNRWMHRPNFDWGAALKRSDPGSIQHTVFSAIWKLIEIRKASPLWADLNNTRLVFCENHHVFAFSRYIGGKLRHSRNSSQVLIVMNFDAHPQLFNRELLLREGFKNSAKVYDEYTGSPLAMKGGFLELQPYQFYFIRENQS